MSALYSFGLAIESLRFSRYGILRPSCSRNSVKSQEYEGRLNFATDAWTSPNHQAYVAVTVHLEKDGKPLGMLLDVVEVAKVRTPTLFVDWYPD